MSRNNGWQSVLKFFAELGDLIAKYAAQPGYAIAMVVIGWIIWPIGALIASLLIARLYFHATQPASAGAPSGSAARAPSESSELHWPVLAGLLLIVVGIFWLARELIPHISFAFVLIALGLFLILFGFTRRGGTSHD